MHKIDSARRMDDTKMLWHMDRVMARLDRGERVAPAHIDMGIAKFCNILCSFCYGKMQKITPVYIKREALLQTVNDAADIGVRSLAFIGDGEPTCNPHLYEALELAKERSLDMAISTNGVLVDTEEKCKTILSSCKWMRFCFSAGTREGYKEIHGKDYFDRAVGNIKMMVETKKRYGYECEIGMQAVFVPTLMADEILAESRLAVDLGVDYLVIKQCSLPDAGESGMAQFDLNLYDDKKIIEILTACQEMGTDKIDIIPKWNVMHQKGQRPYNNCPSISLISEISGNGDWCTCGYFFGGRPGTEKYKFGNVHEKSLKKIWLSNEYWDAIKYMEQEFDNKTMCKGACRQDKCNEFCDVYRNKPRGINFV